jgi:oligo-1,6-glucosidase
VHDDYDQWNVAKLRADPDSVWNFYARLLRLRKERLALIYGTFIPLDADADDNYSYLRHDEASGEKYLVLNLGRGEKSVTLDPAAWGSM